MKKKRKKKRKIYTIQYIKLLLQYYLLDIRLALLLWHRALILADRLTEIFINYLLIYLPYNYRFQCLLLRRFRKQLGRFNVIAKRGWDNM